jgi:lipid-A-disaccharide synthase-like uncharacterized protein
MTEWISKILEKLKDPWIIIGFVGQTFFYARFIIQWIASERAKKVVIPISFWYASIIGSVITLAYAIYRADPIFILGFSLNIIIYVRNLMLLKKDVRPDAAKE